MDWFQALVLALIQGLTEFLPISSSAHLILPSQVLGWPDQGLAFDVAVHLGTLMAVMAYYRRDLFAMIGGAGVAVTQRTMNEDLKLGLLVVLATIPAVVFGFLGGDWIEQELRSALVIAITTLVFGALLWAADAFGKRQFSLVRLGVLGAIFIGLAQALYLAQRHYHYRGAGTGLPARGCRPFLLPAVHSGDSWRWPIEDKGSDRTAAGGGLGNDGSGRGSQCGDRLPDHRVFHSPA